MADLNVIYCSTDIKNTGYGECVLVPGFWKGAFRVPKGKVYTQAELTALRATLVAGTLADSKTNRIFPLHGFRTITDNSEETVFETLGDGGQKPVRDGNYNITFRYTDGGLCLSMALRSFNFKSSSWIFYDDQFQFFGWRKLDATGLAYGLGGIPTTFHANKWKHNSGSEGVIFSVYYSFDSSYLNDSLGFVKADFNPAEVVGLQTVALKQVGAASLAGVSNIQATTGCDGTNMYDLYSADLADPLLWVVTRTDTGAVLDVDTVVANPALKAFTLGLDVLDPDYVAAGAGGDLNVTWIGPTGLDTADIPGFEANTVVIKRG